MILCLGGLELGKTVYIREAVNSDVSAQLAMYLKYIKADILSLFFLGERERETERERERERESY